MPLLWISGSLCLIITIVLHPQEIFTASLYGLKVWWEIVFPSLLPFFIIADLFMSLGAIRILGSIVEPLMRPLFNLPGESALVVAIGYTSGFPIGAAFTAKLRKANILTQIEAERLLTFTNNASPLFMLVALSVGILGLPDTGIIIAVSHYLANIFIGLLFRFYGNKNKILVNNRSYFNNIKLAFQETFYKKTKPIGFLLGDAIKNAMQSLTSIGGYIIFFAVTLKSLELLGFIKIIETGISILFPWLEPQLHSALANGFFEMTIGCKSAGEALASIQEKLVTMSIILAWSGLSIHAQVLGQINETDIRYKPFFVARILHAIIAAILCKVFYTSKIFKVAKVVTTNFILNGMSVIYYEWVTFVFIFLLLLMVIFALIKENFLRV